MRTRKNVNALTPTEKTAFVNAVLALKTKPSVLHPTDPNLRRYDDFAETHMHAMMAESGSPSSPSFTPGWAHLGPAFFPWHRAMLVEFEKELPATVAIPYWDWPDPTSSPFTPDFLGGDGDPADSWKVKDGPFASASPAHWTIRVKDDATDPDFLQRAFFGQDPSLPNTEVLPTTSDVNATQLMAPYDSAPWKVGSAGYRSSMEFDLHNLVHRWVGGSMLKMTSPNDPVFWLHHCNIDRLWARWQDKHPLYAFYLPPSGAAPGHNLNDTMIFSHMPPAPWATTYTPAGVVFHQELGYKYDDDPVIPPSFREPLSFVRILFGVINDAPGVVIGPNGPQPVPGGPGDPVWRGLSAAARNELVSLAVHQLAGLIDAPELRQRLQTAVMPMIGKNAEKTLRAHRAESPT